MKKLLSIIIAALLTLGFIATAEGLSVDSLTVTYVTAPLNVPSIVEKENGVFTGTLGIPVEYAEITSGADQTLHHDVAGGVGFTAITVAWLSQLQPIVMVLVSLFIAVMQKGAGRIQTDFGIPDSASDVLLGIMLFFMLGCEFFINYRLIFRGRKGGEQDA